MLKNMKISVKLIGISILILLVALGGVAVLSVSRSSAAMTRLGREQMIIRPKEIAKVIDKTYAEELKLARSLAADPQIIAAVAAVNEKGIAGAKQELAIANAKLAPFSKDPEMVAAYEAVNAVGLDAVVCVTNTPASMGKDLKDRGYVTKALAGQSNIGNVLISKVTGKPVSPLAVPMYSGDTVVGAFLIILNIDFLNALTADETVGKTGYTIIVDNTGLVIAHPNKDLILKMNVTQTKGMEAFGNDLISGKTGVDSYIFNGIHKTAGFAPVSSTGWSVSLGMEDTDDTFLSEANNLRNLVLIVSAVVLLVALLIYWLFSRTITRPLAKGVSFAQRIAAGDFSQLLDIQQKDEIGVLAAALNAMSEKLKNVVSTIQNNAQQVAASSEQISVSARKLSEGAQSQASTLEETSASVEQLTASVDQVSSHAQSQVDAVSRGTSSMNQVQQSIGEVAKSLSDIAALAGKSVENALQGAKAVSEVVEGINLIAGSSEKIGGIVNVISDIADQTNLLALNASIEAARAGEHGRGFAVVADEVSKLADRSSSSTKEIESLIKESVKNVTKGVETARGSQKAMEQIRDASRSVKEMISALVEATQRQVSSVNDLSGALGNVSEMSQSISAATEEQTTNAKQVAQAVENVNDVTQAAAAAAEEMSASTVNLADMARQLQELTGQFKIGQSASTSESGVTETSVAVRGAKETE